MDPDLQGEVLRVDPEGVEADGLKDLVPLQPLEPAVDVGAGERVDVAHVEPLGRGVGEHHEVVVGAFGLAEFLEGEAIGALLIPALLPTGFDPGRIVAVLLAVRVGVHLAWPWSGGCGLAGLRGRA
jgi:hypothetical protein